MKFIYSFIFFINLKLIKNCLKGFNNKSVVYFERRLVAKFSEFKLNYVIF